VIEAGRQIEVREHHLLYVDLAFKLSEAPERGDEVAAISTQRIQYIQPIIVIERSTDRWRPSRQEQCLIGSTLDVNRRTLKV
jgi:hypothetical protein